MRLPSATRFSYQLTIDPPTVARSNEALFERAQAAVSVTDPWNKAPMLVEPDAYAQLSTAQLPAAAPERWRDPGLKPPPGRLEQHSLASERLGHTHALTAYVPAGYDQARKQQFPLLIFFDGESYLRDEDSKTLLDALIAERAIEPLVALFVVNDEPSQRTSELPCNAELRGVRRGRGLAVCALALSLVARCSADRACRPELRRAREQLHRPHLS